MQDKAFLNWWHDIGSGFKPLPGDEQYDHDKHIAGMAWKHARASMDYGDFMHFLMFTAQFSNSISSSLHDVTPEAKNELIAKLVRIICLVVELPWLGNATTRQLLDEIAGRSNLDYRPASGNPASAQAHKDGFDAMSFVMRAVNPVPDAIMAEKRVLAQLREEEAAFINAPTSQS